MMSLRSKTYRRTYQLYQVRTYVHTLVLVLVLVLVLNFKFFYALTQIFKRTRTNTHTHTHECTAIIRAGADDKIQQVMTSATNLLEAVLTVTRKAKLSRYVRTPLLWFILYYSFSLCPFDACMVHTNTHMNWYVPSFHFIHINITLFPSSTWTFFFFIYNHITSMHRCCKIE